MAPKKALKPSKETRSPPAIPSWPALSPRLPPPKQRLTTLHPGIITTPLLPAPLCATYRSFLATLPLTVTPVSNRKTHALRVNDRFSVSDAAFAHRLWRDTGLGDLVTRGHVDGEEMGEEARAELWGGEVLGLNENVRVYRYRQGQFFEKHYDEENMVVFDAGAGRKGEEEEEEAGGQGAVRGRTTWTLLVYLSGRETGCEGGETVFWPGEETYGGFETVGMGRKEAVVAEMEVGMALLHRHGKECLLHQGREVIKGEKWVIRSDLVVRR
ncbi:hypothetical protein CAC42_1867 [Sphaceloma murrayae]|uniref:Prolyl 4-hydroxylase alpha subunit Fe(2+) 2OG dioxygenase domain-containing protein n=1 Tax=Sphaceloma murrayae TaxID=2082308 RepID=A0A2K1QVP1_9PEZI|nr:hypothetical protein CAC42_1867 [Sphaceloma murrayae]